MKCEELLEVSSCQTSATVETIFSACAKIKDSKFIKHFIPYDTVFTENREQQIGKRSYSSKSFPIKFPYPTENKSLTSEVTWSFALQTANMKNNYSA